MENHQGQRWADRDLDPDGSTRGIRHDFYGWEVFEINRWDEREFLPIGVHEHWDDEPRFGSHAEAVAAAEIWVNHHLHGVLGLIPRDAPARSYAPPKDSKVGAFVAGMFVGGGLGSV